MQAHKSGTTSIDLIRSVQQALLVIDEQYTTTTNVHALAVRRLLDHVLSTVLEDLSASSVGLPSRVVPIQPPCRAMPVDERSEVCEPPWVAVAAPPAEPVAGRRGRVTPAAVQRFVAIVAVLVDLVRRFGSTLWECLQRS